LKIPEVSLLDKDDVEQLSDIRQNKGVNASQKKIHGGIYTLSVLTKKTNQER
jgi:hypothetical protein